MAQATLLPDGMYEVQLDDGSTYTTPEYIARDMAPDSFQDAYDQAASGVGGYAAEVPPWEVEAQAAAPVMGFAPDVIEQPPEMTFSEAEAGPADVFPGSGASWAAEQGLGAQQQGPGSRSFGMSVAGTGPYREAPPGQFSAPPSYADERSMAALGTRDEIAAAKRGSDAASVYAGRVDELNQEREIQRQETYEQWDAMHAKAMQGAEQREAEIQQAISQIPKMDPQRIWSNTDNATKFGGIMAAAVAGWLHPGKPNEVIAQMQALADRDARAQQTDIETAKFRVGAAERAYGRYADRAAQDKSDYIARRAFLEAGIINTLAAEKEKYQSVITQSNFDAMIGASKRNLAGLLQASRQAEYTNIFNREREIASNQQRAADRRQRAAEFRASMKMKQAELDARRAASAGPERGQILFELPDGRTVYARQGMEISPEERKKIREKMETETLYASKLQDLKVLVDRIGRGVTPNERAELAAQVNSIVRVMREEVGANLPEDERKNVIAMFGSPESILKSPETTIEIIDREINGAPERIEKKLRQYGPRISEAVQVNGMTLETEPRRMGEGENIYNIKSLNISDTQKRELQEYVDGLTAAIKSHDMAGGAASKESRKAQIAEKVKSLIDAVDEWDLGPDENAAMSEIVSGELARAEGVLGDIPFAKPTEVAGSLMEGAERRRDYRKNVLEMYSAMGPAAQWLSGDGEDAPYTKEQFWDVIEAEGL